MSCGAKYAFALFCALLICAVVPDVASAQAASQEGAAFMQKIKDSLHGPIGQSVGIFAALWGSITWWRSGLKSAAPCFAVIFVVFGGLHVLASLQAMMKV